MPEPRNAATSGRAAEPLLERAAAPRAASVLTPARLAAEMLERGGALRPIEAGGASPPLIDAAASVARALEPFLRGRPAPVVATSLPNGALHLAVVIGAWMSGAAVLAIGTGAVEAEIERTLAAVGPAVVVSALDDARFRIGARAGIATAAGACAVHRPDPAAAPAHRALGPSDALILSTSGSTAEPKFVVLTASAIRHNIDEGGAYFALGRGDRMLIFTPAHFALTFVQYLAAVFHGATPVCWPHGLRSPRSLAEFALAQAPTGLWANPTSCEMLIDALAAPLATLRFAMLGGQPLGPRLFARLREALPQARIVSGYGITENVARVAFFDCGDGAAWRHLASAPIGRPIPGVRVAVAGPDGGDGEFVIAGASLMRGYLNELSGPEAAIEAHATGDLGRIDAALGLVITGRRKLMINVGNTKVSPEAIEAVLRGLDGVVDAAAGAGADELLGEAPVVLYASERADDAALRAEMAAACRRRLGGAHVPRRFLRLRPEEMPRTKTGKIDRVAVKSLIDML